MHLQQIPDEFSAEVARRQTGVDFPRESDTGKSKVTTAAMLSRLSLFIGFSCMRLQVGPKCLRRALST